MDGTQPTETEQIIEEIKRARLESDRFAAEQRRYTEETFKLIAEQRKLDAEARKLDREGDKYHSEARKLDRDRALAPVLASAGFFSLLSGAGAGLAVWLLGHYIK